MNDSAVVDTSLHLSHTIRITSLHAEFNTLTHTTSQAAYHLIN